MKFGRVTFVLFLAFTFISVYSQQDPEGQAWHIKAYSMTVDNCPVMDCPCLLGGAPYHGTCSAIGVIKIEDGNYGDVSLKGQLIGFYTDFHDMMKPDHMGIYIDQNANPKVKKALTQLFSNSPFGLAGEGYKIKETTIRADYRAGEKSFFSIGDMATLTLTPLIGGNGKKQLSINNPVDTFGAKVVYLNNGQGFFKDYGKDLTYKDNSGEIESFEISSGGN